MSSSPPGAGTRTAAAMTAEGDNSVNHRLDCATSPRERFGPVTELRRVTGHPDCC